MKMSLSAKSLPIFLLAIFLFLTPLLQIKALAPHTTTSLSLVNTINVAGNETDFHALLAIKSNIIPEYRNALSSWNESLHFCHWEGVKCGRRHERVTVLNLTSRGLMGSLSPYIGNLSFLWELALSNNTFTGEIPTEVGNLFRLQKLNLSSNNFEGTIPRSLSRCSNLSHLYLGKNKLVGEFPKELPYSVPRLKFLSIPSNNLTGGIPSSMGNLTSLVGFYAYENPFGGSIPNALGQLKNLSYFILGENQLSGTIPPSLYNLSLLVALFVPHNRLQGSLPPTFGLRFPHLQFLVLAENQFSGALPLSIGNLTSLVGFNAYRNPFGGSIPNALGQLKNLSYFILGENQLSGTIPPSLYNLSLLVELFVSHNRLQGSLPPTFGFIFPHLQFLNLDENQFSGPLPLSITNLSQLVYLELATNHFNGKLTIDFRNLRNLQSLSLVGNNFESWGSDGLAFLSTLTNCSNLKEVGLGHNQFRGVLPDSVGNLSISLFWLDLSANQLYGSIPSTIGNLVNLENIYLYDNLFTGSIPHSIGNLNKIQRLVFANNTISGEIPKSIGNMSLLNVLDLTNNRLEGAIPLTLGNCRNLLLVSLSDNNLNGSIPRQLLMVTSLSIALDLARNRLSGSLPLEVGKLKNLAYLDISENVFSGEIPSTLGSCSVLENLYMQRNLFRGSIPQSMEPLRGIQNLDLSHNYLSGQIPRFLETFDLKNLNLSFNNFEGDVPMKGVFTNVSAIAIAGNYRLCGGIAELRLPRCNMKNPRHKMSLLQMLAITIASVLIGVIAVSFVIIYCFKKKRKTQSTDSFLKEPFSKVTYGELLKATEGFSSTNLLGFGSFGRVFKGIIDKNRDLVVAVKVFDLQTRGATKSFMAECEALRNIRHRNLVSIITCCSSVDFQGNEFKALVYEFMPNGSLDNWLHPISRATSGQREFVALDLMQRIDIAIDVACALDYLHHQCGRPIIHCDLKPSNVLLDSDMVAHVGDFGLARFRAELATPSTSSSTAIKGTIGYAAPEYGLGSKLSTSGDVYSYGILLLEMITNKRPIDKIFEANLNLHHFAKAAFPQGVMEIVDPMLLQEERHGSKVVEYLVSIVKIGLACSTESPKNRMSITNVLRELHLVKNNILKGNIDS